MPVAAMSNGQGGGNENVNIEAFSVLLFPNPEGPRQITNSAKIATELFTSPKRLLYLCEFHPMRRLRIDYALGLIIIY